MTEPTDAELGKLAEECGIGWGAGLGGMSDFLSAFARAVLAKWGTQPQAGAVPQRWKAVPVNPTPEMWKAAKTVPDPNPPYPPHYGLVWEAMLAASPTPPAEQQTQPGAVYAELPAPTASIGTDDAWHEAAMRDFADRTHALRMQQAQSAGPCAICGSDEPFTGTCGSGDPRALCQQAAPKAAPGEPSDYQILAITTAYEQGVGKGHQAYKSGKGITNPYDSAYGCDLAWQYGYREGKEQAQREANAAPQPAPGPLSDAVEHYLGAQDALDNREYGGINAEPYEKLLRRRNASRNDLDAAIAAQGGNK